MKEPWAQVFTPENAREPNYGASSGTRKPCKTGYIGGLQGVPLCGCKNGAKTTN